MPTWHSHCSGAASNALASRLAPAGYYNTETHPGGYAAIADLCARYGAALTLTCVEMCDSQHPPEALCGPEGLLRTVGRAAGRGGATLRTAGPGRRRAGGPRMGAGGGACRAPQSSRRPRRLRLMPSPSTIY